MLENRSAVVNTSLLARSLDADLPSRQRAKRTNDPCAALKTNTARGRRIADLVRAYLRALSNPARVEQQAAVIAAAELQVLAEEARSAALRDAGRADLDQVIRVQGAADRAVRRLGIKLDKAPAPGPTSFAEIAARAQAEASERRARELADDETTTPAAEEDALSGHGIAPGAPFDGNGDDDAP